MANPIGISFMPSDENQAMGPKRGAIEGNGGNLADAFKILSLQLPSVLGARSISSPRLLTSPGSTAIPGAFNPMAAVLQAMLHAASGGSYQDFSRGENPGFGLPDSLTGETRVIPGQGGEGHYGIVDTPTLQPPSGRSLGIGNTDPGFRDRRY